MLSSIGKFSKSFFIKVLVGIIILPFVFWGMGDVFRGGNQNIVITIDSKKVTTQEFLNYINRLNLTDEDKKNISKNNLLERILADYAGKKIIELELEKMDIKITDKSLKRIITKDQTFFKDGKFSRTEYEKFLLKSSISAPGFEQNIAEQEKKRQLLSYLSSGVSLPQFLIESEFKKENQIKYLKFINLDKIYKSISINESEVEKIYSKNKEIFSEKFKIISYAELTPNNLTGVNEAEKKFFDKIDEIENSLLDGQNLEEVSSKNNIKLFKTNGLNKSLINENGQKFNGKNKQLIQKVYNNKINEPEILNFENKYYLAEVTDVKNKVKDLQDPQVQKAIRSELLFGEKLKKNSEFAKKISVEKFSINDMKNYANQNNIEVKSIKINGIENNEVFNKGMIKRIFEMNNNEINLITDSVLSKNYLVYIEKTEYNDLIKSSKNYKKYESNAKLNLSKEIYSNFDKGINTKYDVEVNDRVIDRIKNSL